MQSRCRGYGSRDCYERIGQASRATHRQIADSVAVAARISFDEVYRRYFEHAAVSHDAAILFWQRAENRDIAAIHRCCKWLSGAIRYCLYCAYALQSSISDFDAWVGSPTRRKWN